MNPVVVIPTPPRLAGRAKISLSLLPTPSLPVRAGLNLFLMMSSRGCNKYAIFGMVRSR